MGDLSLEEVKQIELEILKEFKSFCENAGITYFLSNGTLLGAVKYKGFIPWDDDIDVFVPRKDYMRLIKEYPRTGKLDLLCAERNEHFFLPFAKLSDTSTVIRGQIRVQEYTYGVHIDIFPLDFWNDDIDVSQKCAMVVKRNIKRLLLSTAYFSKGRTWVRTCVKNVLIACARIKGWKHYKKKLYHSIKHSLELSGKQYSGCVAWPIYGKSEILDSSIFSDVVYLEFEGEKYPAPIGYDTYLRSLYGEYEKDPPKSEQRSHHYFRASRI